MRLHLASGSAQVSAPLIEHQLHKALVTILRTVDGRFQCIKTEIPQMRRGFGVAAALSDLAVGTGDHLARVQSDIAAAQADVEREIQRCKSIVDQADRYTDALASIADHIISGTPIRHEECAPELAEAGKLMRRSFLLGDPDGLAQKTANVLQQESEEAAGHVATAADTVRRLASAIKVGMFKQKLEVLERLKTSSEAQLAILDDRQKRLISNAAESEATHYRGYREGYIKTFQTKEARVRLPNLKCLARLQGRIVRTAKAIKITPLEVV